MVKASDPIGPLANAQALAALGLQVLPARHAHELKAPIIPWKKHSTARASATLLASWFSKEGPLNYWVMTGGISGVVVIDCDNEEADAWWRSVLGDAVMDKTAQVKTSKGTHYWFRIPADWGGKPVKSWSKHPLKAGENRSFDFRADGTGVIAPPSVHESGVVYKWVVPFAEIQDAPVALLDGTHRKAAPGVEGDAQAPPPPVARIGPGGRVQGTLADLLLNPPSEGGRNAWLTNVAGHYAADYRNAEDLYLAHCQLANATCTPPLERAEYDKTVASIWAAEQGKPQDLVVGVAAWDSDSGWLRGAGRRILTQTKVVDKDPLTGDVSTEYPPAEWADFDAKCLGVILGGEGESSDYWVKLFRSSTTDVLETVLPGATLGDTGKLTTWLSNKRCTILPPDNMFPRSGAYGTRLQRYLESQAPPKTHVTQQLGWSATALEGQGGFVTLDEIITPTQRITFEVAGIRPDPRMKQQAAASHHYGFRGSKKEARRVLREVLTYQDETTCSVFGAWWAACLLKPQLQGSGMFPFMAIEAPSESGKTTGFFNMMVQMNGSTKGQSIQTGPATRNAIAAHNNGIVWIDDMDNPERIMELLRTATANGTIAKQGGADFGATMEFHLVAPVFLSGEALGISMQKATADRAIQIEVTSPTKRRSLHDPSRPQWDDIQALQAQYPELSALAGWYVQMALGQAGAAQQALRTASHGDGRSSQKHAVLLAGARLLDSLTAGSAREVALAWEGEGTHFKRVSAWVGLEKKAYNPDDNALTQELLPWALRHFSFPSAPEWRANGDSDPVWVEGGSTPADLTSPETEVTVWFHPGDLALAWAKHNRGKALDRVHTEEALRKQADVVRTGANKRKRQTGGSNKPLYYYQIGGAVAARVLGRATGR